MRILSFLSLVIFLVACTPQQDQSNTTADKLSEKARPNDHVMMQRSYPDLTPDVKAMQRVAERAIAESHSKSVDHPWQVEGPTNIGGRINTLAIDPNDELTMYAGSCTGGVFKTSNGGDSWDPIGDDFQFLPIGHIVINPNNSDDILVGTGDPQLSGLPHIGNGVYRSFDGGDTWTNIGLEDMGVISKVGFHPEDDQTLFACAMGVPFAPGPDRGFYRTTDGGMTWTQQLFLAENAGITDFKMNPENPDVIYAAGWNRIRNNQESIITGEQSRIHRSTDGGDTWVQLVNGLPMGDQCRIGLEMSQNDPNTLWALVVGTDYGVQGIYKTTDGGDSWVNLYQGGLEGALGGFGWYFGKIRVNPFDENEITILGVDMWTTYNNCQTWEMSTPPWWEYDVHADKHDLIYLNPDTMWLATDGGIYRTGTHFIFWDDADDIPNTQFYRIALNPHNPGVYTGGAQDNGTTSGNLSTIDEWTRDYGGDGFQTIYDPVIDGIKYMETQNGNIVVSEFGNIFGLTFGLDEDDRRNWDMPYIMSHFDNERLYTGTEKAYWMNGAPYDVWEPISQDLTDGNIFGSNFHTISTIGEAQTDESRIMVGTSDANVWLGTAGGNSFVWQPVTGDLPERYVTNVKSSPETEERWWISHSGYKDNDQTAHLHRTDDNGANWIDVTGDLPEQPVNHIEVLNDSILFIATDYGVYHTVNSGDNWVRIGNNMPAIPVFDLEIDTTAHTLVAGTFARGIWTFPIDSLFTWPEPEVEDDPINIDEELLTQQFIYPNPASDQLRLVGYEGFTFEVYDLRGQLVLSKGRLTNSAQLDVSQLKSGKYVIVFTKDQTKMTESFIKR
ncbi:VPS10 domain-containing protein [Sanyastnella coralliicola]|uniref:VPS10 domain-containing protein n=1 Tax=Sanyastnella coralliicola TaxID=3069118 RepID=UPI0027B98A60|nr:T9SS type A sorting domain-containing protein [Longitalea sp. SCSIO 12813]